MPPLRNLGGFTEYEPSSTFTFQCPGLLLQSSSRPPCPSHPTPCHCQSRPPLQDLHVEEPPRLFPDPHYASTQVLAFRLQQSFPLLEHTVPWSKHPLGIPALLRPSLLSRCSLSSKLHLYNPSLTYRSASLLLLLVAFEEQSPSSDEVQLSSNFELMRGQLNVAGEETYPHLTDVTPYSPVRPQAALLLPTSPLCLPTSQSSTVPHDRFIHFPSSLSTDFTSYVATTILFHPPTCP